MSFDASDFDGRSNAEFIDALVTALNAIEARSTVLIETIDVGSTVDNVMFSGLDGDSDLEYLIAGDWLYPIATSDARLGVHPNGITFKQRTIWGEATFTSTSGNSLSRLVACVQEGGTRDAAKFSARLSSKTGQPRQILMRSGSGSSSGVTPPIAEFTSYHGHGLWNDTTTNITSLTLQPLDSAGVALTGAVGAGSFFSLYRIGR